MNDDYFIESIPNGIAGTIDELFPDVECCGQDGYELLIATFGENVDGERMKAFTHEDCKKMADEMQSLFEMKMRPTNKQAEYIIKRALDRWGGPDDY